MTPDGCSCKLEPRARLFHRSVVLDQNYSGLRVDSTDPKRHLGVCAIYSETTVNRLDMIYGVFGCPPASYH